MRAGRFDVRPLGADEWGVLKALRLAALAESPDAFGPSFEATAAQPDEYWIHGARRFAGGTDCLLVAWDQQTPVALVSAVLDRDHVGTIGAMWVAPTHRGRSIGSELFDAACEWLADRGAQRLKLWVTEGNEPAVALYRRRGFAATGVSRPLRHGSTLLNVEMTKPLLPR